MYFHGHLKRDILHPWHALITDNAESAPLELKSVKEQDFTHSGKVLERCLLKDIDFFNKSNILIIQQPPDLQKQELSFVKNNPVSTGIIKDWHNVEISLLKKLSHKKRLKSFIRMTCFVIKIIAMQ
ncbi:MAG: hypothetical protein HRT87_04930 [Legionellales bacterium]|nr:hypothetical protein [Legionellales bacterium]